MAVPGFYVASGAWASAAGLHKVGHSGDLRRRLLDDAYVTCFPEGHWRFEATLETGSKAEAARLEAAVLHCAASRRLGRRELLRMGAAPLQALAEAAAARLGIPFRLRVAPAYARPPPAPPAPPSPDAPALAGLEVANACPEVANACPEGADAANADLSLDALLRELLLPAEGAPAGGSAAPPAAGGSAAPPPAGAGTPAGALAGDLADADGDVFCDEVFDAAGLGEAPAPAGLELRGYQQEAAAACLAELGATGATVLQMACRCGKTAVAASVLAAFRGASLFLVPGLALLRQTAQKLAGYGYAGELLLVGSDPAPVPLPGRAPLSMTTDPGAIAAFAAGAGDRLVVSTYQSSPLLPAGAAFALTVFDEAHRVCGGRAPRPFNSALLRPRTGARLFMTATPAFDPPRPEAISMKDRALFGGVAFRYHLRQGIAAGFANDFRLELVACEVAAGAGAAEAEAALPSQVAEAMGAVDKLLVFCRDIGHAERLCAATRGAARDFECLAAHSRMGAGGAAEALRRFAAPGRRAALFNCRLFQEGVEIPELGAVFFAAPRHSPKDIIQSVCRPLNVMPGKGVSVVFLPVVHDPLAPPEGGANLRRFAAIIPFVDALLSEDPRLYEHLLDPEGTPYPLSLRGAAEPAPLLAAVRRAVRYGGSAAPRAAERLLRAEAIPWEKGFGALARVVAECGRYPKTTDLFEVGAARASLHGIYRHYAAQFLNAEAGLPSSLEPFQLRALGELPGWRPFGLEGPYPWRFCLDFLEAELAASGGVPPMVEILRGGYVGLEATPMERLSGLLTTVNQADGKAREGKDPGSGYTLSAEKQADLRRVCAPWGLRWQKERGADGALVPGGPRTFIQEAYDRFKAYYAANPDGDYIRRWFPDYPQKHRRQESLAVQAASHVVPVRRPRPRRGRPDAGETPAEN